MGQAIARDHAKTTCGHRCSAHRRSARAHSAGDRPGLVGRRSHSSGAPRRLALHMLRQHTSFGGTLAHHDVCPTPPYPRPRQELETRLATSVSSSAQRTTSSTCPPPRGNVRKLSGGSTSGRPGAQRPRHRRRAHSAQRRPGCRRRPGAQRPCHRRRARSARRRWQPSRSGCPAWRTGAQRPRRRAPSAERRARGGDQARRRRPGAQRPRHRRRARSARRRWLRASGCPTPHTTAGRLLPASATI